MPEAGSDSGIASTDSGSDTVTGLRWNARAATGDRLGSSNTVSSVPDDHTGCADSAFSDSEARPVISPAASSAAAYEAEYEEDGGFDWNAVDVDAVVRQHQQRPPKQHTQQLPRSLPPQQDQQKDSLPLPAMQQSSQLLDVHVPQQQQQQPSLFDLSSSNSDIFGTNDSAGFAFAPAQAAQPEAPLTGTCSSVHELFDTSINANALPFANKAQCWRQSMVAPSSSAAGWPAAAAETASDSWTAACTAADTAAGIQASVNAISEQQSSPAFWQPPIAPRRGSHTAQLPVPWNGMLIPYAQNTYMGADGSTCMNASTDAYLDGSSSACNSGNSRNSRTVYDGNSSNLWTDAADNWLLTGARAAEGQQDAAELKGRCHRSLLVLRKQLAARHMLPVFRYALSDITLPESVLAYGRTCTCILKTNTPYDTL